jgi:predicted nucleic acid-binding OB-fold protein
MNTIELQNDIIRKILNISDKELLDFLNNFLSIKEKSPSIYRLNDFEKKMMTESLADYQNENTKNHTDVVSKIDKWLEE